ncbi:hypothetical protein ABT160_38215 [Streptomyces sp. NPDC001941]|uniref:DUF5983 family protein n=1 Tax=Streptomyces sp. NPDC001941 TaxID=3154659 RepID=UPI00331F603C
MSSRYEVTVTRTDTPLTVLGPSELAYTLTDFTPTSDSTVHALALGDSNATALVIVDEPRALRAFAGAVVNELDRCLPGPSIDPTAGARVRAFLDLSTAHLSPATHAWLAAPQRDCIWPTDNGWFMWVPTQDEDQHGQETQDGSGWPDDLLLLARLAREHHCSYILLDRDVADGEAAELVGLVGA